MSVFEILVGLPPYGEPAQPFPESGFGSFREGLVIRFCGIDGEPWVGNFQRGFPSDFDFVIDHPDCCHVIVIAGGEGYFIDPATRR